MVGNGKFKSWLRKVEKDTYSAECTICSKTFDISSIGESALTSYMKGKKHCERATSVCESQSTGSISKSSLDSMIVMTSVAHAEICGALKIVSSKYSKSSSDNIGQLFRVMFPDSKVAESFSFAKIKSRYIITYGLAPYFFQ